MNLYRPLIVFVLLFGLLVFGAGVVLAQDVTPEPEPPPVELPADSVVISSGQLLLYLGLAILGGGGLLAILYRVFENKAAQDSAEKLYLSTPPETQLFIRDLVKGYKELSERLVLFLEKVTDGQINALPPVQVFKGENLTDEELLTRRGIYPPPGGG